ncbi:hypothetical protein HMI56_006346 [Coelomomyces lativittatus]|nr:hypothetical protein HMI56_006346 [Coelomomyces lativittatus]
MKLSRMLEGHHYFNPEVNVTLDQKIATKLKASTLCFQENCTWTLKKEGKTELNFFFTRTETTDEFTVTLLRGTQLFSCSAGFCALDGPELKVNFNSKDPEDRHRLDWVQNQGTLQTFNVPTFANFSEKKVVIQTHCQNVTMCQWNCTRGNTHLISFDFQKKASQKASFINTQSIRGQPYSCSYGFCCLFNQERHQLQVNFVTKGKFIQVKAEWNEHLHLFTTFEYSKDAILSMNDSKSFLFTMLSIGLVCFVFIFFYFNH